MIAERTLTRSAQFALNGRAVWRDLLGGHFTKIHFHLRGCWRAFRF